MRPKSIVVRFFIALLCTVMSMPPTVWAQASGTAAAPPPVFKSEELEQILAPVALYPDSLLSQILMASTYPLEVVQADHFTEQNKDLKGEALTAALEKQTWDPSVKSLVNFPQILTMMNEKLDWTLKLGDAFLGQQKEVMDTVQVLRKKAEAEGNLKTTAEQKVVVEQEKIIIEYANPQVVYVPTYNPTVVYGYWPYPSYPPYYYYPPGYTAGSAMLAFGTGVAVGAAWGYAWGNCNWNGGDVDIDYNRNTTVNNNINREQYKQKAQNARGQQGQNAGSGSGKWQHNQENRKGVAYRDQATGQKYNRVSNNDAAKSRENFRGRAESGRQDISRGGADQFKGGSNARQRDSFGGGRTGTGGSAGRDFSGQNKSAFGGMDRGGQSARNSRSRGSSSRQSSSSSFGGGSRGGGGRSGGGSRGGGRGGGGRR